VSTTLIGGVILEDRNGRTHGVDMRVYRWLEQWLSEDEARELVYSLKWQRLIRLIVDNRAAIDAMPIWSTP